MKRPFRGTVTGPASRGFTLIELLIVIVIIAILASVVVVGGFGGERSRELRTEAERLAQLIELARDEAVLRNEELGLKIADNGYHFLVFDDAESQWRELETRPFHPRTLAQITLRVEVEQRQRMTSDSGDGQNRNLPEIIMFSSGEQTAFDIELSPPSEWQIPAWSVRSDGLSRTTATIDDV